MPAERVKGTYPRKFVETSGGGGSSDHAALSHLGWTVSGHTGTASRFAVFDSGGAAAYLALPSTGLVAWTGSAWAAATVSAPLAYSAGTLSIPAASSSVSGYLSSTDWTVFNGKEPAISAGTTSQYWRGDKSWQTLDKAAVGLGSVENTALSTWAGSTNLVTLGTIGTGTWHGAAIGVGYGGTGLTSYTTGDLIYASGTSTLAALGIGTAGYTLGSTGTAPTWRSPSQARSDLSLVVGTNVQAWDADLDAIAALTSTGILVRTGSGTAATRQITAGAGITVTNATGVAGDITVAIATSSSSSLSAALSIVCGSGANGNVAFDGNDVAGFTKSIVGSTCEYTAASTYVPDWKTVTVNTATYTIVIVTKGIVPKLWDWVQTGANDCIIHWPATSASGGTQGSGAASISGAKLLGGGNGGAGRTSSGAGTAAAAGAGVVFGKQGATGGKGANGTNAGGAGGALTRQWTIAGKYGDLLSLLINLGGEEMGASTSTKYGLSGGTGGGGGGAGGGTTSGGGGGGGGPIVMATRSITVDSATAGRLILRSAAGNGGNAASIGNVSSGGGGGGSSGNILLLSAVITGAVRIESVGGNGGNGSIAGTATAADGGDGGSTADVYVVYGSITADGSSSVSYVSTVGTGGTKAGTGANGANGTAGGFYTLQVS